MSIDLSQPLRSIEQPLHESIRELRQGYQTVSECLQQTIAECDLRGAELADCRRQLAEARRGLSEYERQIGERARAEADLVNRCATLKRHLDVKQAELTQASEKLVYLQAECQQNKQRLDAEIEHNQQLRSQFECLAVDRESSRREVEQLRNQSAPLAETIAEAARLRGELAAAQAEAARLREQLADNSDDGELRDNQVAQVRRQQLESELDMLREHDAELSESLAQQLRQASQERQLWHKELQEIRRVVERQGDVLARCARHISTPHPAPEAPARNLTGRSQDNTE